MKKMISTVAALAAFLLSASIATAQTPEQKKFLGTWDLSISGMPNGTMETPMTITFADDALKGTMVTPDGEEVKFDSIEVDEDVLIVEFEADDFVVNFELSYEEDGTLSGTMMNAFTVKGKKVEKKEDKD